MSQRRTQSAEQHFRMAKNCVTTDPSADAPLMSAAYQIEIADGLLDCALAIRDIYDKLAAMDSKFDAIVAGTNRIGLR